MIYGVSSNSYRWQDCLGNQQDEEQMHRGIYYLSMTTSSFSNVTESAECRVIQAEAYVLLCHTGNFSELK